MRETAPVLLFPPDQRERERALDAGRCILVRAPAGSGKTDLLTRRFLRLLAEVDQPDEIVAITFTKAAAAEMQQRILAALEKAAAGESANRADDPFSMEALAQRALLRSRQRGWNLLELPAQLRISTIDSFCRELAIQQPLLSGLGGGLEIDEQPAALYRRAARRTLEAIGGSDPALREAIEALLLWRDNGWQEIENQLVEMLASRDRWMHDFVVGRTSDWDSLRERLERPFRQCAGEALARLSRLLDQVPHAREEILELARFACAQSEGVLHQELAELAEFPALSLENAEELDAARQAYVCLSGLLLTTEGALRKQVDKRLGFPAERKVEKLRLLALTADLRNVPGLEAELAAIRELPPARYTEEDWRIVRASFLLLRRAAAELKVVFAETGTADYIEVSQIAEDMLKGENEIPSEAALAIADKVRHFLVDEFQDTSRRQHRLLGRLIAAWAAREGRTCFVVGDPMQSIYFFRDADAELFPRVESAGLEIPQDLPLSFDPVRLFANFRTAGPLVMQCNEIFSKVFAENDGSGITFSSAEPARSENNAGHRGELRSKELPMARGERARMQLHLEFMSETVPGKTGDSPAAGGANKIAEERRAAAEKQAAEIVDLIRSHLPRIEQARAEGAKYRIAVLGRTRPALAPVAEALRAASIPFRAIELEKLKDRPEIRDALALTRALLSSEDRVAWLGVLRAPWCGLSLDDLHKLVSADRADLLQTPVPKLLAERRALLSAEGQPAAARVLAAVEAAQRLRFAQPAASAGTWIEQVWLQLGGALCMDAAGRANVDLLWRALDRLPNGEQDLLGPALDAALEKLTALPDPAADPDCGVQLMTIHKSKGLEFEIVIVPDLQSSAARGKTKLLSWLERGLAEADAADEPTEFLVAPLQAKGSERGTAKAWVDCVYRSREVQEMRRLLYVAATRAREELHLFARPAYKGEKDGSFTLVKPRESLLATAWPAVEAEVRARFDALRMRGEEPETIDSIAAAGAELPPASVARNPGTPLRRLPPGYEPQQTAAPASAMAQSITGAGRLYERHEGGVLSRALGTAVHALLEELARLRLSVDAASARSALARMESRMTAQIRAAGIERPQAMRIARDALAIALKALGEPIGEWILSPHAEAASEVRWAGVIAGDLQTVQVDRVFRAGPEPLTEGGGAWWVIDFKTAQAEGAGLEEALPKLRTIFAPQVESYAKVLRNLHGAATTIRCGLYYPRMLKFDWWEI